MEKKAFASAKKFKEAGKAQQQTKELQDDLAKWQEALQTLRVKAKSLEAQLESQAEDLAQLEAAQESSKSTLEKT